MNELKEGCTRDPKLSGDYNFAPRLFYITSPCITKQIYTKAHQKLPHKRRMGTPGYKPLESLLESDLISSAVDIFAAGSIYVLLLLRKEIFFVQNTPGEGIMELCKLFGAHRVSEVALHLGKTVTIKLNSSTEREMKDLSDTKAEVIFCRLRSTSSACPERLWFSLCAFDLLKDLLALSPSRRKTAAGALCHRFFKEPN